MPDQYISSGASWEAAIGYSRAIRTGNHVYIAGTTAVDENGQAVGANIYEQARFVFQKIVKTMEQAGGSLKDVVRTRMFVTDISRWEDVGRAHHEFFHDIRPAATMVEVKSLIRPELLIEVEADAVINR